MTNWTQRARLEIPETGQGGTDKTDKRGVSSVSSVGVWAVLENGTLAADLIEAAMRVCDRYGDGEAAREEMRADCLALPPYFQVDLLEHFKGRGVTVNSTGGWVGKTEQGAPVGAWCNYLKGKS